MIQSNEFMFAPSITIGHDLKEMQLEVLWRMMDDSERTTRDDVSVLLFGRRSRGDPVYGTAGRAELLHLQRAAHDAAVDFADPAYNIPDDATANPDDATALSSPPTPGLEPSWGPGNYAFDRRPVHNYPRHTDGFMPLNHTTPTDDPDFRGRRPSAKLSLQAQRIMRMGKYAIGPEKGDVAHDAALDAAHEADTLSPQRATADPLTVGAGAWQAAPYEPGDDGAEDDGDDDGTEDDGDDVAPYGPGEGGGFAPRSARAYALKRPAEPYIDFLETSHNNTPGGGGPGGGGAAASEADDDEFIGSPGGDAPNLGEPAGHVMALYADAGITQPDPNDVSPYGSIMHGLANGRGSFSGRFF
jgi:hypothetical protein